MKQCDHPEEEVYYNPATKHYYCKECDGFLVKGDNE